MNGEMDALAIWGRPPHEEELAATWNSSLTARINARQEPDLVFF
jgi:hypothetical protein